MSPTRRTRKNEEHGKRGLIGELTKTVRRDGVCSFDRRQPYQRLALSRAPQRQNSTRLSGATAPARCYTAPRMRSRQTAMLATTPAVRTTPKAAPHLRNRDDPRTLTVAQRLDATTGDGLASSAGSMREPTVFNNARARAAAREAWLLRTGRRHDPNDPHGRSSQMPFFFLCSLPRPRSQRRSSPHG